MKFSPRGDTVLGHVASPVGGSYKQNTQEQRIVDLKTEFPKATRKMDGDRKDPAEERPSVLVSVRVLSILRHLVERAAHKDDTDDDEALDQVFQDFEKLSVGGKDAPPPRETSCTARLTVEQLLRHFGRVTVCDEGTVVPDTAGERQVPADKTELREEDSDSDDNDLCSRTPSRRYHPRRVDDSPYANVSQRHHSGGGVTFAAIDPNPVAQYQNIQFVPQQTGLNFLNQNGTNVGQITEDSWNILEDISTMYLEELTSNDCEILKSVAQNLMVNMEASQIPQSIDEINALRDSLSSYIGQTTTTTSIAPAAFSPASEPSWQAYDSGIGSASSSPVSLQAPSPAGSHAFSPRPSPPDSQFYGRREESTAAEQDRQDFETLDQIACNNLLCDESLVADDNESFVPLDAWDADSLFGNDPAPPLASPPCYPADSPVADAVLRGTYQPPQYAVLFPVVAVAAAAASPPLKPIKPKVDRTTETLSGRERMLNLMDKQRKAEAWIRVSLKLKEAAECDQDGDTQLMIVCSNSQGSVEKYALEYVYALVEMLKDTPGALSAVNNQQHSALFLAARHSDFAHRALVVRYLADTLLERGEAVAQPLAGGNSLVHELCRLGDNRHDVLTELLALRDSFGKPCFDVNAFNADGKTPLHLAASHHPKAGATCDKTVQLLVAEGADIRLPDKVRGDTALHLAIVNSCAPSLVQALLAAARIHQAPEDLAQVCNARNANRDTPLHSAASRNDVPVEQQKLVIRTLLYQTNRAGKSLNAQGKYPIMMVAEERRQEIRGVYERA